MKRIFIAIKIEPHAQLIQLMDSLKASFSLSKIKWVELHNLHITLKFLGETPDEKVTEIASVLQNITQTPVIHLEFTGLGVFGSRYKPRIIWMGINDGHALQYLENEISLAIQPLGYQSDRQNFVPHLTLGRINFLNDKSHFNQAIQKLSSIIPPAQSVTQFHLFESKLMPTGPIYSVIKTYGPGN